MRSPVTQFLRSRPPTIAFVGADPENYFRVARHPPGIGAAWVALSDVRPRHVKAHRKARMGRNAQTGEAIKIKAKTVVRLRPAKVLKHAVLK